MEKRNRFSTVRRMELIEQGLSLVLEVHYKDQKMSDLEKRVLEMESEMPAAWRERHDAQWKIPNRSSAILKGLEGNIVRLARLEVLEKLAHIFSTCQVCTKTCSDGNAAKKCVIQCFPSKNDEIEEIDEIEHVCVDCRRNQENTWCDMCQCHYDDESIVFVRGVSDGIDVQRNPGDQVKRVYFLCEACRYKKYIDYCECCQTYTDFNVEYVEDGVSCNSGFVYNLCRDCQHANNISFCQGCFNYKENVIWYYCRDLKQCGYDGDSACPECRDIHGLPCTDDPA